MGSETSNPEVAMTNSVILAAQRRTSEAMLEARRVRDNVALEESRISKQEYLARQREIEKVLDELARTPH